MGNKKSNFMRSIKTSFSSKSFKYGGFSTLITFAVIAILIGINLIVGLIPFSVDLTRESLYTLSEESEAILDNLTQDIKIYGMYETGKEDATVEEAIAEYASSSNKITYQAVNPIENPAFGNLFTKDGETLATGSIVVTNSNNSKYRVISGSEFYYTTNYNPLQTDSEVYVQYLVTESLLSSAIMYVNSEVNPVIYNLTGHVEAEVSPMLISNLKINNYEVKDLDLTKGDAIPEDCSAIIINGPQIDISGNEYEVLLDYLNNQGKMFIFFETLATMDMEFVNLNKILEYYGAEVGRSVIIEEDTNHFQQNKFFLIPLFGDHEINESLVSDGIVTIIPGANPVYELELSKSTTSFIPLLTTSASAWADTNIDSEVLTPDLEAGEETGINNIAVLIEDVTWNESEGKNDVTQIFVMGSSQYLTDNSLVTYGNNDFIMNTISYMVENNNTITIKPKLYSDDTNFLRMTANDVYTWLGITVILIPLLILGTGLYIWLKRRHL